MKEINFESLQKKFYEDTNKLLNELEQNLLELENKPTDKGLLESVFRAMHTLKGVGSMYSYHHISDYTHLLENIYDAICNDFVELTTDIFDITFRSVDHIRNLLNDINLEDNQNAQNQSDLIATINHLIVKHNILNKAKQKKTIQPKNSVPVEKKLSTWLILFRCSESLIFRCINVIDIIKELRKLGNLLISKSLVNTEEEADEQVEFWEIYLQSDGDRNAIEDIFLWLLDDCKIYKLSDNNLLTTDFSFLSSHETSSEQQIISHNINELSNTSPENGKVEIEKPKIDEHNTETKTAIQHENIVTSRLSVDSEKLDTLMYIMSEMITLKSELKSVIKKHDEEATLAKVDKFEKLAKQLRNVTFAIRLVEMSELTLKFKRLVRDLCQSLGKKVEFVTHGETVELDKNIINSLSDPLMHLIRNSIDHGIEMPDERVARGKNPVGTVKLSAYQSGSSIFIRISDDGKGINKDKIRCKAVEMGLIASDAMLSEKQIFEIIFQPGFSTAEHLTQVSGRGVGMDVVKRKISDLRGEIEIESQDNIGSTFTIKLQQTLAIMDTLLIKTGKSFFTIPLTEIEVCEQEKHNVIEQYFNSQLPYKDQLIPFVYLRQLFKIEGGVPETEKIIIIEKQGKRYAIIADSIIGEYQAVLKPVGDTFKSQECISGASVMGDGGIAVMLDTNKLIINM